MTTDTHALILDLVEWVAARPRPYAQVMEAWGTWCPALTIWEDAIDQGLVVREHSAGVGTMVKVTLLGQDLLIKEKRLPDPDASSSGAS